MFFFSAAASPSYAHTRIEQDRGFTQGLIIPPCRQPTPYGKILGDIHLLDVGSAGPTASPIASFFLKCSEEVVDVRSSNDGLVVRASAEWIEHNDAYGLEKLERTHNVEDTLDVLKLAPTSEVCF